jgi:histidinol-phosphate aminotransferase
MPILAPSPLLPPVAAYIRDCATYQPGKPIEEVQRELGLADIIKLASNENPLGPSPKALQAIQEELPRLQLYPDASHFRLREALAGRFGTDLEEVMVGNGSEEIFSLLIRSYCAPGDNTVSCGAAFLAYRVCSQVHGAEYREPPLSRNAEAEIDEMLKLVDQRTRIVFLPNPNNPTGTYINRALLKKTLDALKGRELVVLLDYAYREYASAPDLPGPMEFYRDYPNLIVTGTFSKIYGLGGLRVGYGLGHPELLLPLRKVKMPFNVTSLGLAGALAALEDENHLRRSVEVNAEGMAYLEREFLRLGLDFWPSQGNFLLAKVSGNPMKIYDGLLRAGVIVRPVAGYGLKEHLRFSVGTGDESRRLVSALETILRGER